jgi:hypoxanthine phosphoribosyltransferase
VTPLYTREEIESAIERLAREIALGYAGKPLVLLGVLKGALYVTADLSRALSRVAGGPSEIFVDYVCAWSYGASTRSSGEVHLTMDASVELEGRDVLLIEDIADNGFTLAYLQTFLERRRPASVAACVLFDKPARRSVDLRLAYVGLTVPDAFVVGYGLDYQELYRNLPYLAELSLPSESQRFQPT